MDVERGRTVKGWRPRRLGEHVWAPLGTWILYLLACSSPRRLLFCVSSAPWRVLAGRKLLASRLTGWWIGSLCCLIFFLLDSRNNLIGH